MVRRSNRDDQARGFVAGPSRFEGKLQMGTTPCIGRNVNQPRGRYPVIRTKHVECRVRVVVLDQFDCCLFQLSHRGIRSFRKGSPVNYRSSRVYSKKSIFRLKRQIYSLPRQLEAAPIDTSIRTISAKLNAS
jgi:hypothetical protein